MFIVQTVLRTYVIKYRGAKFIQDYAITLTYYTMPRLKGARLLLPTLIIVCTERAVTG